MVSDSGEGVKPEDAERIFEPFVQGAAGLTRRHGGTGLGLPISRRLARLMGGDVTLDSGGGTGAVFTLRLPAGTPGPEPHGASAQPREAAGPMRVAASRGLAAAGETLLRQIGPTVAEFVRRARAEPALPVTDEMTDVDVADHLGTLLIDVANSLAILARMDGESSDLLADGARIQRLVGELHGAQRQRLGWTEPQVQGEAKLVREVCFAALGLSLAGDDHAHQAAAAALERLLDERTRACLSGFRTSAGASI